MRLRGMNFCTSSAHFALSFVRQLKGLKCIQIVPNTHQSMSLGPNGVNRNVSVAKKFDATSWHEFLHQFSPFCTEFCKAIKRSQMHPNSTTHTKTRVRSHQGQSGAFVAKNFDTTSWHEFLNHFGSFCTEFCKATKQSRMHPNSTKHTKI